MFQRFHAMKEQREGGFTLIELLVVILIIAILAAIAIPVFLNQRKKGWISQSQSALKNAATAVETYSTQANCSYLGADGWVDTDLSPYGYNDTTNVDVVVDATAQRYCITATHSLLGGDPWASSSYDSENGNPTDAACPATL